MFYGCFLCSCGRLFGARFWDWCGCGVAEVHVVFMVIVRCRAVICALIVETLLTPGSMKHSLHTSCWRFRSANAQLKQKAACWNWTLLYLSSSLFILKHLFVGIYENEFLCFKWEFGIRMKTDQLCHALLCVYISIIHWCVFVSLCQVIWPHNKYFTLVELRCSLLCLQNRTVLYTDVYSPCPYIVLLLLTAFSYNISFLEVL